MLPQNSKLLHQVFFVKASKQLKSRKRSVLDLNRFLSFVWISGLHSAAFCSPCSPWWCVFFGTAVSNQINRVFFMAITAWGLLRMWLGCQWGVRRGRGAVRSGNLDQPAPEVLCRHIQYLQHTKDTKAYVINSCFLVTSCFWHKTWPLHRPTDSFEFALVQSVI